jgi:hypothetical protein
VQKKRHLINGRSMVEVIYRKSSKSPRKLNEPPNSGDRSDQAWDPEDYGNPSPKKSKKLQHRSSVLNRAARMIT